jgi:hypothetical protein
MSKHLSIRKFLRDQKSQEKRAKKAMRRAAATHPLRTQEAL